MTTFSQLVDDMILETRRPDLRSEVVTYLNQTVREAHFTADRGNALFFDSNFNEVQLIADTEAGFTWTFPNPTTFQKLAVVGFPNALSYDGQPVFSTEVAPNRLMAGKETYHYRVGNRYVFSGYGGLNARINLGYYAFPRSLVYQPVETRKVQWDVATQSWVWPVAPADADEQESWELEATNWLILRWADVIREGLRAKVYKRLSDTERGRTCYSMYTTLRQGLWTSEVADLTPYY